MTPERTQPRPPAEATQIAGPLIRRGADLVYLTEDLYLRLFTLTVALLAVSSAWSVDARVADPQRGNLVLTIIFATSGVLAALTALVYRRPVYRWLRRSRLHQTTPAIAGITMMLADGPHSATWWIAFALLFVMAAVSSTTLTTLAAIAAAAAYLGGTLIYGSALIYQGDTGNLIGAGMLIINALGARAIAETFGQFVLRLHRLESQLAQPQAPLKIDLAAPPPTGTSQPATATQHRRRGSLVHEARTPLTTRQLEAVLLARDGLHQHEIANCLAISQRQVERLMEQARARAGAATTSELIAMLVRGKLVPAPVTTA